MKAQGFQYNNLYMASIPEAMEFRIFENKIAASLRLAADGVVLEGEKTLNLFLNLSDLGSHFTVKDFRSSEVGVETFEAPGDIELVDDVDQDVATESETQETFAETGLIVAVDPADGPDLGAVATVKLNDDGSSTVLEVNALPDVELEASVDVAPADDQKESNTDEQLEETESTTTADDEGQKEAGQVEKSAKAKPGRKSRS